MTIIESLAPFTGSWQGHNKLRIMPTDDYQESVSAATVTVTAGAFVTIEYTWAHEDKPQSGLLLLGSGPAAGSDSESTADGAAEAPDGDSTTAASGTQAAKAVWVDSFHSGPEWLTLDGTIDDDGVVRLTGWYPAPQGPDWGWQIHVHPGDGNGGRITMHNMVPGHDPYQVVDATYRRQA